jgi:hypothetical protein
MAKKGKSRGPQRAAGGDWLSYGIGSFALVLAFTLQPKLVELVELYETHARFAQEEAPGYMRDLGNMTHVIAHLELAKERARAGDMRSAFKHHSLGCHTDVCGDDVRFFSPSLLEMYEPNRNKDVVTSIVDVDDLRVFSNALSPAVLTGLQRGLRLESDYWGQDPGYGKYTHTYTPTIPHSLPPPPSLTHSLPPLPPSLLAPPSLPHSLPSLALPPKEATFTLTGGLSRTKCTM